MTFDEIKKVSKEDLQIHKDDLVHASSITPTLNHKYLMELFSSRDQLSQLEYSFNVLYKSKWLYYSGKGTADVYAKNPFDLKVLKSDLQIFFDADQELNDAKYKITFLKNKIDFITKVIEEINRRSFLINNINNTIKYESGVV